MLQSLRNFIKLESSSAIILLAAAVFALILSNSPWHIYYDAIFHQPIMVNFFNFHFEIQILHLTDEGLMTIFFLLVGLEVKYELCYGALNSFSKALLPGIAAIGGMAVPAVIYIAINYGHEISLQGWAIPTATDIAFSLGVLALLGSRIPATLKIFLMALAIFDDLAAIIVIAIFYTSNLSFLFLGFAFVCVGILVVFNVKKVNHLFFYSILGIVLWFCLMKSGVHPTLAGGILAFLVPLHSSETLKKSPAYRLKHKLHAWVAFGVLPLFAFANAGVSFVTISPVDLEIPVILGIFCGLFFGKQIGVLGFCWLSVKCRLAELPENVRWRDIYAIAILCGIGFTISLFIGTLAFGDYSTHLDSVKIGVILGSLLSGVMGYVLLLRK
ncbi:MAG: Na+/H+ antiporter NhaA [Gammaproteobacteria bacterium]|nr:Na+/H+ antiporter NhaA [Gammaproteobacteria bacterium]